MITPKDLEKLKVSLTYDDVLLVPKRSKVRHRADVSLKTKLTRDLSLNIPLISANMDTVTESKMAIALARNGGVGIIHRFMPLEEEAEEVKKVKVQDGHVIDDPFTLPPDATLEQAKEIMDRYDASILVTNRKGELLGILTHRDIKLLKANHRKVSSFMTKREKLITAPYGTTLEQARKILQKARVEKLPLTDKGGYLKGLITVRSILGLERYPRAAKDSKGRLLVGAATGVTGDYLERTEALLAAGVDVIVVDVAHGHNEVSLSAVKKLRKTFKNAQIIGGNVATAEGTQDLIAAGVDAVKVGIGSGGLCNTRVIAGIGVPQFSALVETSEIAKKSEIPIISDGGTNYPGDIVKALAAGASAVMLAGWFAGTDESPGGLILRRGLRYKVHRGSASFLADADRKLSYQGLTDEEKLNTIVPEGVESLVPYKGGVNDVIHQLLGSIRSGMSYCNATTIEELQKNAEFIRVTEAGFRESRPHSVSDYSPLSFF